MNVILIGDVVGRPGREALKRHLPRLREEHGAVFTVVNAENIAGGNGVTPETAKEVFDAGADCLTSGNHVWDRKEVLHYIVEEPRLLRPANYPDSNPGSGLFLGRAGDGTPIAVINVMGRVYMGNLDCPFRTADRLIDEVRGKAEVILVDVHAEVTSEKSAMGWYLDGRVSAVYGTHTHVPTADERILPEGTAYQTDLGMTGPYDSVIGVDKDAAIQRFLSQRHVRFKTAEKNVWLRGAVVDIDETDGRARSISRIAVRDVP